MRSRIKYLTEWNQSCFSDASACRIFSPGEGKVSAWFTGGKERGRKRRLTLNPRGIGVVCKPARIERGELFTVSLCFSELTGALSYVQYYSSMLSVLYWSKKKKNTRGHCDPIIEGLPLIMRKFIQHSRRESKVLHQGPGYGSILTSLAGAPKCRAGGRERRTNKPLLLLLWEKITCTRK